jgi:hypothetical protein
MRYVAWITGLAIVLGMSGMARASDPIGIYARVTKVVLEPNADKPERAQVWGTFALAVPGKGEEYTKPAHGYLYYSLTPGKEDMCRKEWADLKKVAGTEQCVSFASRYRPTGSVRKADQKPKDPDPYPVAGGLFKVEASNRMAKVLKEAAVQ